ncbi:hypothetical protein HPB48_018174 [Haemaphysalis longicornis]|uniref:Uncharacterized protein n=1 Tax=Haemaphysalis longicornis TaxID=44386 RepID=A0A9J6GN85_HAELO|nr:hypothetical protein HPB48_018174 [Haemaphysalis longicornis]
MQPAHMQNRSEIPNPKRDHHHASLNIPVIRLLSRSKNGRMRQSFTVAKKVEVVEWHRKAGSNVSKAAVSEEVVPRSFKRCGISKALDGSEDRELHERLASTILPSAALPTMSNSVREEVVDLLFGRERDCSFDGFDDE